MIGRSIGPYQILAELGRGGMGEVYRARDTKLDRDVALKILPESFANDPDRRMRFEREAKTLASLNHPNIAAIYGIESNALVMELVDGEDLSAIIARHGHSAPAARPERGAERAEAERMGVGPHSQLRKDGIPIEDTLAIAKQIAHALEAAHDRGIIHRDLKPQNIKVRPDGTVKVLDFGLAKALDTTSAPQDAVNSPTMTSPAMTAMGVILGTAAYMSPEQAKGKEVDRRADIWAFGVVLHEMLTGQHLFKADTIPETLAHVMTRVVDFSTLPATTPRRVRDLLARCLEKDPKKRLRDIGEARLILEDPATLESDATPAVLAESRTPSSSRRVLPWAVAAALAASGITALVMTSLGSFTSTPSAAAVRRLSVVLPPGAELDETDLVPIALSPDGTHLAFTAHLGGKVLLYQRSLDDTESKPLAGTEGAISPFFSSNGKWIGFFANGQLKKVALGGGALEVLCPAPNARGGSWGDDGFIYFSTAVSPIWRVADGGGTPAEFTHLDRQKGEVSHRWPQVLPGNQGLLFTAWTGPGRDEKSVGFRSPAGEQRTLVPGGDRGRFVAPRYLVYARGDNLMALPFDPARPDVGDAAPVQLPGLIRGDPSEGSGFEVAASGVLATLPSGPERLAYRLVLVDQAGRAEPLAAPVHQYAHASVSPDGTKAALQVRAGVNEVWIYDFASGSLTPLVRAGSSSQAPTWSSDSKYVIYRGTRNGTRNIYRMAIDGTGIEERLTTKEGVNQTPQSTSPDGKWLAFSEVTAGTKSEVWIVSLDSARTVQPLITGPSGETSGVVSPNGGWVAFQSDDSGRFEVYVRSFPDPGARIPISRDGGAEPQWSRDGRQLFFLNGDKFMAVDVTTASSFSASAPRQLYEGTYVLTETGAPSYGVALDGRTLRAQPVKPEPPAIRIDIVINWLEELRRLVK